MKKRIISILASFVSTKTNEKIENSQIFNLFFRMKRSSLGKTEEENPILKYMDFLKKEFERIQEIYNEFSKSEESYFVIRNERKSMCFLKSSKDYNILKYFAFNIFKNDIFINVRKEYRKNISDCLIASIDVKLLKELKINEKLNEKSNSRWKFVGNEIRNRIDVKMTLAKLKEELIFLTVVSLAS